MSERAGWVFPRVGQRVRITESSPWPERVGCEATVVAPPADGTYPQPAKWEVLLLLDDDPLTNASNHTEHWTCVMTAKACEVIG